MEAREHKPLSWWDPARHSASAFHTPFGRETRRSHLLSGASLFLLNEEFLEASFVTMGRTHGLDDKKLALVLELMVEAPQWTRNGSFLVSLNRWME